MRSLETARLRLLHASEPLQQPVLEQVHRMYVHDLEGEGLTIEALEEEILFDVCLSRNHLGLHFGRPAVHLKENNQRIGHCLFLPRLCTPDELSSVLTSPEAQRQSSVEIEIGWAIANTYRNQGYATEAARALIQYGFGELGLARLIAFTDGDNLASLKVMHHIGMRIGQLRGSNSVIAVIENVSP